MFYSLVEVLELLLFHLVEGDGLGYLYPVVEGERVGFLTMPCCNLHGLAPCVLAPEPRLRVFVLIFPRYTEQGEVLAMEGGVALQLDVYLVDFIVL